MQKISRRNLLKAASSMAAFASLSPLHAKADWIVGKPRFIDYPFKLGVASGDPMPGGFILWTRLAPNPLDVKAVGQKTIPVAYEIAEDANFGKIIKKGKALAHEENAHSVHVYVEGLQADRPYYYRFMAGDEVSPVGRARTAPAFQARKDEMTFAFASCQQYEMGYFSAYRDMVHQDVDFVVHLGDYIYENSWNGPVRRVPVEDARTLDDYRGLHAVYKLDEDLQKAHAHTSWAFTWDDHEVANDYAADQDEDYENVHDFLLRRAAAYKAYYEHLPLSFLARPKKADMRLYQRLYFGNLLEFNILDTRQYRDDQPCQTPENGGWRLIEGECAQRFDEKRSILGQDQERWLLSRYGMGAAKCKWNILAQGMLFSQHDYKVGKGSLYGSEYWDGYLGSRNRVLENIQKRNIENVMVIGGDVHASYVCDIKEDFDKPESKTLASEFVTTSISSPNSYHDRNVATLSDNPHIQLYDGRYRGYTLCKANQKMMQVDLRIVDDALKKDGKFSTNKSYVIEDGVAGAVEA